MLLLANTFFSPVLPPAAQPHKHRASQCTKMVQVYGHTPWSGAWSLQITLPWNRSCMAKKKLMPGFLQTLAQRNTVVPNPFANTAVLCFLFQLTSKDSEVLEHFDLALRWDLHPESSSEPTWQCHSQLTHCQQQPSSTQETGTRGNSKQHFQDS